MNKKNKLIIGALVLVLVVTVVLVLLLNKRELIVIRTQPVSEAYEPEFMTDQEKTQFNLPQSAKIQVLKREDDGGIEVYKVIRDDRDIIYNLNEVTN